MPNPHISNDEARAVVNTFKIYFKHITFYSWLREPDYCTDFRARWAADLALSSGDKPQRFELASFYQIVRDPAYVKFLKEVGTKKVQPTLFGLEATTDRYVGRKGAFQEILKATEILIANDIAPRWQLFINEENKDEIVKLLALIQELRLKERCPPFTFFIQEGSCDGENAKLYPLRIKKESVTEDLIPYYWDFEKKQTEQDLVKQFKADGALSGYYMVVVKGVNKRVSVLVAQLKRTFVGVVIHARYEADFGSEAACGLHPAYRRALGQADYRLYAVACSAERNALRVVAGRAGNDTFFLLLVAELRHFVIRAANLERACYLQILGFKVYVALGVKLRRVHKVGMPKYFTQHIACFVKVV